MSLGTLILYNGEITKNQIAKGSGAGVYVDGGNFYMYKGSISDNKVTINGIWRVTPGPGVPGPGQTVTPYAPSVAAMTALIVCIRFSAS